MSKYVLLLALATLVAFGFGCTGPGSGTTVAPGQAFDLKFGQTVTVASGDMKIKFTDMLGDSRCPLNAVCIWEGEVTCRLDINYGGKVVQKMLVKSGNSPEYATTDFAGYTIRFDVQPYPEAGKSIAKSSYFLRLIITKGS
jgi:hypothetical protein